MVVEKFLRFALKKAIDRSVWLHGWLSHLVTCFACRLIQEKEQTSFCKCLKVVLADSR